MDIEVELNIGLLSLVSKQALSQFTTAIACTYVVLVLTMVGVGGLTLTVCLAVLCTGIICLRRWVTEISVDSLSRDFVVLKQTVILLKCICVLV